MKKTVSILTIALLVSSTLAILKVAPVYAADISFTPLPADGVVSVEFVDSYAVYINDLYYVTKSPPNRFLFNTATTHKGATVFLGSFAKGELFEFLLVAKTGDPSNPTYTWSTNPAKNSDGKDHIHWYQKDAKTWLIKWEDMWNLGDNDFDDAIMTVRIGGDEDGDGLWDVWETNPLGADTNWDGVIELPRSATFDPDPKHKDIFVEVGWMQDATHSHELKPAAAKMVKDAFKAAHIPPNLDGTAGIELHLESGNSITHSDYIHFDTTSGSGVADFDDLKKNNFGENKRSVYHYCIMGHKMGTPDTGKSGMAEGAGGPGYETGNDLIVALGGIHKEKPMGTDVDKDGTNDVDVGTAEEQACALMHELGHNLGLGHGGLVDGYDKDDKNNYKPNYLSIMNYFFQWSGIIPRGTGPIRLDYSREKLPDLNENHLDETKGIQNGADKGTGFWDGQGSDMTKNVHFGWGNKPIDWNWNTNGLGPYETDVPVDINNDKEKRILYGFDDWDNLRYFFTDSGWYEDGAHIGTTPEMDLELSVLLRAPIADAGGPYAADEGTPITFDASGSSDPNGDPLVYRWDFDSDGVWDTGWSGPTASHTWYDDLTSGIATVEVYDGLFYDTDTADVTVYNVPPTVDAGPDQTVYSGDTVSFSGSFTDPGTLDTHTIEWEFGDGTPKATNTLTPTHVYLVAQDYTVTLTVTDDDGGVGVDSLTITVKRIPVPIDIKPGSDPNSINPGDKGLIPVAILNDASWTPYYIDPTLVDPSSAVFGPNEASPVRWHYEDVDKDGDIDLILFFNTQETGIKIGDTSATLNANLTDGRRITGVDDIWTAPRKKP